MKLPKDISGLRFGRLTAVKFSHMQGSQSVWLCHCDCGTSHSVQRGNLGSGHVTSCGCAQKELTSLRKTTHGESKTPEYQAWIRMRQRCLDPDIDNYANYGGRGISVSPDWVNDFPRFLTDVGPKPTPKHSLDRIDVNGNYEPGNVRWATAREQQWNQRHTRMVERNGELVPAAKLAYEAGVHVNTLMRRIERGWDLDRALSTPINVRA